MAAPTPTRSCSGCGARLSRYNKEALCNACARKGNKCSAAPRSAAQPHEPVLWVGNQRPSPPDGSTAGEILRDWRVSRGMTQTELARLLNWTQPYLSQLEGGRAKLRSIDQLWHVQRHLDIPPEELGLAAVGHSDVPGRDDDLPHSPISDVSSDAGDIERGQRQWRMVRHYLDAHRARLTSAVAGLYADVERVGSSSIITKPSWMVAEPVPFADVGLSWTIAAPDPEINGRELETRAIRPLADSGEAYERYSRAMRDLARPRLFENRPGYRLIDMDGAKPQLTFGYTAYFESVIDVSTALAHEYAAESMAAEGSSGAPNLGDLPFRRLVGDPFDLTRRALLPSIDTLTIRKGLNGASFLLHYRDPASVATSSSLYHLMPAGVFQPSSVAPWHQANDFSLWRSSMREFAEEFLNVEEADGSSVTPIDYEGVEPFRSMSLAQADGAFRMWYFGVGLDPLTLCGEILSVAVIDAEVFDRIFAGLVMTNQEGSLVTANQDAPAEGIPFSDEHVKRLLDAQSLAAPAAACLELAWRHREHLLG